MERKLGVQESSVALSALSVLMRKVGWFALTVKTVVIFSLMYRFH